MKQNVSDEILKKFGLLIGVLFPLVFGLILPATVGHPFRFWTLLVSFPLILIGFLKPRLLSFIIKDGWSWAIC